MEKDLKNLWPHTAGRNPEEETEKEQPLINAQSNQLRVSYAHALFGEEERNAVMEVLKSSQIVAGKNAAEFENKIAALFGKKYGIFVNSGSSANLLALESLNLPKGSEVITPILTFSTTVAPIIKLGLIPAFVDVDPHTYLMDVDQVEAMINSNTKAIMVPSLFGNIPDLPYLREIAKKHNLFLIEDSCDTLGATIGSKSTGEYSDVSTTSFYATHIITAAGEGGMVCTNDEQQARKIRILSGWGRQSSLNETEDIDVRLKGELDGQPYDSKFIFSEIGYNMRTTDIPAAFGLVQLKKLPDFIATRRKNFKDLVDYLAKYPEFFILPNSDLPHSHTNIQTAWMSLPVTLTAEAPFSRNDIIRHLELQNIQTRPVFTGNITRHPGFKNIPCVKSEKGYPNADYIMDNGFVFGCHHALTQEHIDHIKNSFESFLVKYKIIN